MENLSNFRRKNKPVYPRSFCVDHEVYEAIQNQHEIQGSNGNWDADEYMLGLFNGVELCLAQLEGREPQFRSFFRPEETLQDPENGEFVAPTTKDYVLAERE